MRLIGMYALLTFMNLGVVTAAPDHIRFGSTGNPLNGLTVSWHTDAAACSLRWGYTAAYEQGTFPVTRYSDYAGYRYEYPFSAVTPAATIHYSIYDGTWTQELTFKTAKDSLTTSYTFIAGGDSRTNLYDWQAVADRMLPVQVDFHLFMGDIINSGTNTTDWNNWYAHGADFIASNLIYHCYGNHDAGTIYPAQFVMPGNEKYYSFTYGNALVICLDSQTPGSSTQYAWLLDRLSTNTADWTIVFFHKPFFTVGSHTTDMNAYRATWWKAFDDYGVDLVLNGHTHNYMRSKPINLNVSSTAPVASYGDGPDQGRLQMVVGGYGAPRTAVSDNWFVGYAEATLHYSHFTVDGLRLHLDTYDETGALIDSLTIEKRPAAPDSVPPVLTVTAPLEPVLTATRVTLMVTSDEPAWLRYGTADQSYASMAGQFTGGEGAFQHSVTVDAAHGQSHTYYVRAVDDSGNTSASSTIITFSVDTTCRALTWRDTDYDHTAWASGPAELGYGDGGEATVIGYGPSGSNKYTAYYFRHTFTVADTAGITGLSMDIKYDDGIAVYVNGSEVTRRSLPSGTLEYTTLASSHEGSAFSTVDVSAYKGLLRNGTNLVAAEVHQTSITSSDISFDLELATQSATLIPRGSVWHYFDKGMEPGDTTICQTTSLADGSDGNRLLPALLVSTGGQTVTITVPAAADEKSTVFLYSMEGSRIWSAVLAAGKRRITWNGSGRPEGIYVLYVKCGDRVMVQSLKLLRTP